MVTALMMQGLMVQKCKLFCHPLLNKIKYVTLHCTAVPFSIFIILEFGLFTEQSIYY